MELAYLLLSLFMSVGWEDVSELRSPTGLLLIPQKVYENGQPRWNDTGRGNRRSRRQTCPCVILSTANPILTNSGSNPDLEVRGQGLTAWAMAGPTDGFRRALLCEAAKVSVAEKKTILPNSESEHLEKWSMLIVLVDTLWWKHATWPAGLHAHTCW
jgi:hypothetical protein